MPLEVLIGIGFAALVILGLALRKLVEWISFPCQFCEAKVRPFRKVDTETQEAILRYFRDHERREVHQKGLFVCLNCKTVHDDFSGEKQSWDSDRFGGVTFCKVCHATMYGCNPKNNNIKCPRCETPYAWQVHEPSGFRFLMPQKAQRFSDPAGATLTRRVAPTQAPTRLPLRLMGKANNNQL